MIIPNKIGGTDLLEFNYNLVDALAKILTVEHKREISSTEVLEALFMLWGDKNHMSWIPELYDLEIDSKEAHNTLKKFDFSVFDNVVYSEYELISDIALYEKKALIKSSGVIWIIHLYDADPFPSNPHAHNIDENVKLDLSNGNCYRVRKYLKTIPKKELLNIREATESKLKKQLPPLNI